MSHALSESAREIRPALRICQWGSENTFAALKMRGQSSFGERIRQRRELAGLTQKQLGAKLGVDGSTVSHWESEMHDPPVEALRAMREIFGVTIDWLVAATNTPPPQTVNVTRIQRAVKMLGGPVGVEAALRNVAGAIAELAAALPQDDNGKRK